MWERGFARFVASVLRFPDRESLFHQSGFRECVVDVSDQIVGVFESDCKAEEALMELLRVQVLAFVVFSEEHDQALVMSERDRRGDDVELGDEPVVAFVVRIEPEGEYAAVSGRRVGLLAGCHGVSRV